MRSSFALLISGMSCLFLLTSPAHAGDGRIEINQARALAGGVSPLDTAGFPVTLEGNQSYVLTSHLSVTDANTNAIEAAATESSITLDLNGFVMAGPTSCAGEMPPMCSPSGTGLGIEFLGSFQFNEIRNGTVTGFSGGGISLGGRNRVLGVRVYSNGGHGIAGLQLLHVENSYIERNASVGISSGPATRIVRSQLRGNGQGSINVGDGSLVEQNQMSEQNPGGISTLTMGTGTGVSAAAYRDNVIVSTTTTVTGGNDLGGNLCNGSTTCP